jgi:HAD superfamily hydrolase (TIGR01549 family)
VFDAVIFDLDDTLLDTGVLAPLREAREWQEALRRLDEVEPFDVEAGSTPVEGLPAEVRRRGKKVGLLTHSPRLLVEPLLDQFGIRVDAMVTGSDGFAPKPNPTGLIAVAQQLGVSPDKCAYVGDSVGDFGAAAAAGMTAVGVAWAQSIPAAWRHGWPDAVFHETDRLLSFLDGARGLRLGAEELAAGGTVSLHWGSYVRLGGRTYGLGRYFPTGDRRAGAHALSELILRAKDGPDAAEEVADIYGTVAGHARGDPSLIVAVPPKPDSTYDRFAPARARLAAEFGAQDGDGVLRMRFDVEDYKHYRRDERAALNAGRFEADSIPDERVILVDDVLNSGGQAEACRDALLDAGASRVSIIALAVSQEALPEACPSCGGNLKVRTNSYTGERFWGCSNFHSLGCTYTRNI